MNANSIVTIPWFHELFRILHETSKLGIEAWLLFRASARLCDSHGKMPEFEVKMAASTIADERPEGLSVRRHRRNGRRCGRFRGVAADRPNEPRRDNTGRFFDGSRYRQYRGRADRHVKWRGKPIFISHRTPKESKTHVRFP